MFQTKFVEKTKTRILFSVTFFVGNPAVCETTLKKFGRTGEAKDDNLAHAHFTLGT